MIAPSTLRRLPTRTRTRSDRPSGTIKREAMTLPCPLAASSSASTMIVIRRSIPPIDVTRLAMSRLTSLPIAIPSACAIARAQSSSVLPLA
jgi:hypothetical protein